MRLIDADALIKKLNENRIQYNADINYLITNAPTFEPQMLNENEYLGREYVAKDLVNKEGTVIGRFKGQTIVRCKDCVQYNGKIECGNGLLTEPDDFCAFGVRKEGEHG